MTVASLAQPNNPPSSLDAMTRQNPHIAYKWVLRTYIDDTPLGVSDVGTLPNKFTNRIRKKRHTTSEFGLSSMASNCLALDIQLSAAR